MRYDALLLVSFGGPEGPDDVMPFLRNVVRGKDVPESRLRSVARNYELVGGVSPINAANRELLDALENELARGGLELPVYWGNRNWHPFLTDTVSRMARDGVTRAIAFATSAYSSYSGCRQYLEDIEKARAAVSGNAPAIDKIRPFYDHPSFIDANRAALREALATLGAERPTILFTAHSLPSSMARSCDYTRELQATMERVLEGLGEIDASLVFQSRSGPPSVAWLEPDVLDALRDARDRGVRNIVLAPIGFVSDHMEVIYDLDIQAQERAEELGIRLVRAKTVGTHPSFVRMIRELIEERRTEPCRADCCPPSPRTGRNESL